MSALLVKFVAAAFLAMPLMMSSGTPANAVSPGKGGPLTPRLQLLADPAFETASAQAQAEKLLLPASGPGSIMERPGGRILVDVRVSDTSPATIGRLKATGARLVYVDEALRIVTAEVAPSGLTALAAVQPQVLSVEEDLQPMHNAACPTGDFVSEGDTQLNAATGRTHYSVNGAGITVGVLSDSYNSLGGAPTDVANGELPGATNPCGFTDSVIVQAEGGTTDEGRAMSQVVHDLAPGADIRFATSNNGEQAFANQIRALATAGAKVIVDDVTYFTEPMYQDGVIGKAVEDVTAQGVTYFSSAGNSNTIVGGNNVASYETQAFRSTTCPASLITAYGSPAGLTCHNFNPGVGTDNTYGITVNGVTAYVLGWNEPQFGITTDLDLCVLNHSTGALLGCSAEDNLSTQKAFEGISASLSGSYDLVVARYAGTNTPRFKLISLRSALTAVEYPTGSGGDVVGPTIFGHNASRSGASVAAIPYNNASTLETFSSRGPATYCWGPVDGTTPAAPLASCETATVDMSATDGVVNSFFGDGSPHRFSGTSAAAPHAAAIAALMLQYRSCLTPAQVLVAMKTTAVPFGAFGPDAMGAGRLDADAAIGAAGAGPCGGPIVFSITPASGPAGGGTTVTITGSGFTGATSVHFGATAAANFTVSSGTQISAVSPAGTGTIDITVTGPGGTSATGSADRFTYLLTGTTYHAITPTRILDTRDGTGGLGGPFTNHVARTFQVTGGTTGVPSNATAVTGNLTVTGQTSSGYLFIGPIATNNPSSSTLNFPRGDDRANAVTVALGAGGSLSITFVAPSNGPTAQAIFDATGYFTPDTSGATYHALSPTRALDTRDGTGGLGGPFTNHAARTFGVSGGSSGVPVGATAVTGNLTVTGQTSSGFLFIGPAATNNPGSSTLNFPLGDDRANAVTVALGAGGSLSITFVAPSNGPTAFAIFDVTGYFTPDMSGATYVPLTPTRVLDTRDGTGGLGGPFTNHAARTFGATGGSGGVPSTATAVTGNLTVTGQTSPGYLFIGPVATNNPSSSTLNFPRGDDRANAVTVALGAGGSLSITFVAPSNGPTAFAIFDATGYFVPAG